MIIKFYVYESISYTHTQVRKYTKRRQQKKRYTSVWSKIIQLFCFSFCFVFPPSYLCDAWFIDKERKKTTFFLAPQLARNDRGDFDQSTQKLVVLTKSRINKVKSKTNTQTSRARRRPAPIEVREREIGSVWQFLAQHAKKSVWPRLGKVTKVNKKKQ